MPHPNSMANLRPPWTSESRPSGGTQNAGASIKQWINVLMAQDLSEADLRAISKNAKERPSRRIAAQRILRSMEQPDPADFQKVADGSLNLEEARQMGVNTEVVRRVRTKETTQTTLDGTVSVTTERELELRDTSGSDFDRVMDRTEGAPEQTNRVSVDHGGIDYARMIREGKMTEEDVRKIAEAEELIEQLETRPRESLPGGEPSS